MVFIGECAKAEWSAQFARHHAENVLRAAKLRQIIHACADALPIAYGGENEPADVLSGLELDLSKIVTSKYGSGPRSIADAVVDFTERIDAIAERGQHAGVLTGLIDFDETTGGLFAGELIILAARTGIGKTSLACQIAEFVAGRGRPVYFASLEMSDVELVQRIACGRAGVSSKKIRNGSLMPDDRKRLATASAEIYRLPIVIDDRAGMTADDICRSARQQKMKHGNLALVAVDYLQRITPRDLRQQRHLQIGEMTDALKRLARELEIPVLCLAQLSREAEKEECPSLRHLRESGSIEQDADMVIFINRKYSEAAEETDKKAELVIAKNRNGETGSINLEWQGSRTRFESEGYSLPAGRETALDKFNGRRL
jgi:replicative DNA helicase